MTAPQQLPSPDPSAQDPALEACHKNLAAMTAERDAALAERDAARASAKEWEQACKEARREAGSWRDRWWGGPHVEPYT